MRILQIGFGKIGRAIAHLLSGDGRFQLTVVDSEPDTRDQPHPFTVTRADASDPASLKPLATGVNAIVSAAPYFLNPGIARLAREVGAHYFDLTESVESTRAVRVAADGASSAFVPQCGIAPGFVCVLAAALAAKFDELTGLFLKAASIPAYPNNRLGYNVMWSLDGVIHEYTSPCPAIRAGNAVLLQPMHDLERVVVEGFSLEAFNTSGGLGTLPETFLGRVVDLNYKSMRYPGHCDYMRFLLEDLGFATRQSELKRLLAEHLPTTIQDLLVVHVRAVGKKRGAFSEEVFSHTFRSTGLPFGTAIEISTAHALCVAVDVVLFGSQKRTGFIKQEDFALADFLHSRFATPYMAAKRLLES